MKNIKNCIIRFFSIVSIVSLILSCSEKDKEFEYNPLFLESYQEVYNLSKEDVVSRFIETGLFPAEYTWFIKYGIKAYRIEYNTFSPLGEHILASGALIIPDNAYHFPFLSIQHGTITNENSAPSNFSSEFNDFADIFASMGYIIIMPDYIGYGASSDMKHPYEHRASLATTCRDMIRAVYEYFEVQNDSRKNSKLFLTGYSEGGFATMATFKLMQEQHSDEFSITAVTAGAGAYNKTAFVEWIVTANEPLPYINSYIWVLDVYNSIYSELHRPYSFYFNEPWATNIANNGVFGDIESNPSILFRSEFIEGIINGTDTDFIIAVTDNNCFSWIPQSPLKLYHGNNDLYVPFFNSQYAYEEMIDLGATNVELVTIENGTHETAFMDYLMGTFYFFRVY
jgi:pimeloyl-ACP methyl ester carboxylesterase